MCRAARGDVCVCHLRRHGAVSSSSRATVWARSRSSTPCWTGCCTSRASCRRSRRRAAGRARSISPRSKGICRSGTSWRLSTIYRGVYKLEPGHWMRVAGGRVCRSRQYWDVIEFDTDTRPDPELLDAIDDELRSAVHARLESEVPLGAFLSGGIDSGLVVSYMAEALPGRLVTASVGFGERAHNELEAAGVTASHFGSRHYPEVIEPRLDEVIGPVTEGLGEPLADSSAIPTWYVSRAAKRHVTVALTGDGGDESFAGYDFRYVLHALEAEVRPWLPSALMPSVGWLGSRWPRSRRLPRALRIGTILENLGRDPAGAYYADLAFLKPHDARRADGAAAGS